MELKLMQLAKTLEGDFFTDNTTRLMYATDASIYREVPQAVAIPKNDDDIKKLISFAKEEKTSLIFRAGGTSLAGQCVGKGIIVDISKHFNKIIELNVEERWVKVQPGVILSELNKYIEKHGLFFGPETSTANRCCIGGMANNNSCGLHSLVYGSTRDHTIEIRAILSDCSEAVFKPISNAEFEEKCNGNSLENKIYKNIKNILADKKNQEEIINEYPLKSLPRRNTGYALDLILDSSPFGDNPEKFNLCKLLAGSEGTLAFFSEIKLNLVPLPPKEKALVCVHVNSVEEALQANLVALKFKPSSVELMDKTIMELAGQNISQQKNKFFIKGEPGAILFVEFAKETKEEINKVVSEMQKAMEDINFGFHFPVLFGNDINKAWDLRMAGLGVLSNMKGDAKPHSFIEDTAIDVNLLPDYFSELTGFLKNLNLKFVCYAHIGTGEIHLKPVLNLKTCEGVQLLRKIAEHTAHLVKKYKGSLSGEHGDGRVRGEFVKIILGEHNYSLCKKIKETFDEDYIFNPEKIVGAPAMDISLRYSPDKKHSVIKTHFDFSDTDGILGAIEKCNGSADCRKTITTGGTMCPVYMATKDERNSTRARANILREFLTNSEKKNIFNHEEIYEVLDLCVSCKGCKAECPSNIDMATYKAEFLQNYFDSNRIPLRTKIFANIDKINILASKFHSLYNIFISNNFAGIFLKHFLNISQKRNFPKPHSFTLRKWLAKNAQHLKPADSEQIKGKVFLFCDEFTNFYDVETGIKAIRLLTKLGYEIEIPEHSESGRALISKGFIRKAKIIANKNINVFKNVITKNTPLLGIEPSAILSFRDEYLRLAEDGNKIYAEKISKNTFLIDEFLENEFKKGNISSNDFSDKKIKIKLHGHCHQKSLASIESTKTVLCIPENYEVEIIASGCCGMAGSFGYENEHYDLSMQIGELVLFPEIRKTDNETTIVAPGTSCRQQIKDGTGRNVYHPVEVLYDALRCS
ncbi:MAG: FAD-linked oxidase C-terminal domain-containing protein [Bacteroidales bacterium]|nr:FAD-linked oxidase C-terminal domain-containing protein [Bacteroidales bacterium]